MIDKSNGLLDKFIDNINNSNRYIKIILILLIVLLTATYPMMDYAIAEEVTVNDISIDGDETNNFETREKTVGDFLEEQGVIIGEKDVVRPGLDAPIIDGMDIEIRRGFDIRISYKGVIGDYNGIPGTVGETLAINGISYDEDDVVSPDVSEAMTRDTKIAVKVVSTEEIVATEKIKFKTKIDYDDTIDVGITKTTQEGVDGEKEVKYLVTYEDDEEVSREAVSETIIKEAVNEVMVVGTKGAYAMPSGGGGTIAGYTYTKMYDNVKAYAYYMGEHAVAASGKLAKRGTCAVDPKIIPLGTKLYIEGYGYAVANDTGGDIIGKTVDLYMSSKQECYNWGVRYVKVYVLE